MPKLKYKQIICIECNDKKRLWIESDCYKLSICPTCIKKVHDNNKYKTGE